MLPLKPERQSGLPSVSIVLPTFNGRQWLSNCVDSLARTDYPPSLLELIIVDNGSSDRSIEDLDTARLSATGIGFRIIRNAGNRGWSPANNQGFRVAGGDILVTISNDIRPEPGWLLELVKSFQGSTRIGVAQCLSLSLSERGRTDSGLNYVDRFGFIYGYEPSPVGDTQPTFFAEGAAFGFTREVLLRVGGLDDSYFMQYDDLDFSWRAQLMGFQVVLVPKSVVLHARGGTVGRSLFTTWPLMLHLVARNHLTTLYKNLETKNMVIAVPIAFCLHALKACVLAAGGELARARAVVGGVVAFIQDLHTTQLSRARIQSTRTVSDSNLTGRRHPFRPMQLIQFLQGQRMAGRGLRPHAAIPVELHE